jgi:hypothetical protein
MRRVRRLQSRWRRERRQPPADLARLIGFAPRWDASMERDSKRIVREWNREIEADKRRLAARDDGRWKIVVWVVLEVIWLVGLFVLLGPFSRLSW